MDNLSVVWIDQEREPQCPANPDYPDGIDIDMSEGAPSCERKLPYPARRCGAFYVKCGRCGTDAIITTAGRRDDPRSVRLRCINATNGRGDHE